jgi:hypothetical protein
MAGFIPAIHVFLCCWTKDVDGRDKPGHDEQKKRGRRARAARGILLTPDDF